SLQQVELVDCRYIEVVHDGEARTFFLSVELFMVRLRHRSERMLHRGHETHGMRRGELTEDIKLAVDARQVVDVSDAGRALAVELDELERSGCQEGVDPRQRSEEHTSELQSRENLVCRL